MDLHQKLARLADKQRTIEAQIAEQLAEEHHAAARALAALIEHQPQAAEALRHPKILSSLSKRDAQRFAAWLDRIAPPQVAAQPPGESSETSASAPETLSVGA